MFMTAVSRPLESFFSFTDSPDHTDIGGPALGVVRFTNKSGSAALVNGVLELAIHMTGAAGE